MIEVGVLYLLGYGLGLGAAKKLGDSGPDPQNMNRTWVAKDHHPDAGRGGTPARSLPPGYGQRQVSYFEPDCEAPEASLAPLPGFEQMFSTPDGGVFTPAIRKQNREPIGFLVEFYANHSGRFAGIIDTGATECVLCYEDAVRMGFDLHGLQYVHPVNTAGGRVMAAEVSIPNVSIGPIFIPYLDACIAQTNTVKCTLLGMTFLSQLGGGFRGTPGGDGLVIYP